MNKHRTQFGLTLIELLVVIAILAIIMGIILVTINPAKRIAEANDSRRWLETKSISAAVNSYIVDYSGDAPDCGASGDLPADNIYRFIGTAGSSDFDYTDDAQGAWLLDAMAAGQIPDDSLNTNIGTILNGAIWDSAGGKMAGAFTFDGADDEIDCGTDNSLNPTAEITITAWIRLENDTDSEWEAVLTRGEGVNDKHYWFGLNTSGQPTLILSPNGSVDTRATGSTVISEYTWYHLAAVYNGTDMRLYLNGVLDENGSSNPKIYSGDIFSSAKKTLIGNDDVWGGDEFNGRIDEVALFDYALSLDEIHEIYSNGLSAGKEFCDLSSDLNEYLTIIPQDPTGADPLGSSGYLIKRDFSGTITVKAPYVSDYAEQEIVVSQ